MVRHLGLKMDIQTTLQNKAIELNSLLSDYILLHDRIFKQSATFRSLFKKIDFKSMYIASSMLVEKFSTFKDELIAAQHLCNDKTPNEYKVYLKQLILFFKSLFRTILILKKRQYLLFQKSEGRKVNWDQYKNLENEYQNAIKKYMAEGEILNSLKDIIF